MPLLPANHVLFQMANLFLGFSYLAFNLLSLRIILSIANMFFVLWAWLILDYALDTIVWNAIFIILNMGQISLIIYRARPIKFELEAHEEIYERLFRPVGISRLDFKALVSVSLCRSLKAGSHYIEAGNTAHSLSVLRSGEFEVIKPTGPSAHRLAPEGSAASVHRQGEGTVINNIYPYEFVESPEFAARGRRRRVREVARRALKRVQANRPSRPPSSDSEATQTGSPTRTRGAHGARPTATADDSVGMIAVNMVGADDDDTDNNEFEEQVMEDNAIGVTIRAKTDSTYLSWPMESLETFLAKNPHLSAPVHAVVGQDIANKLFRQTQNKTDTSAMMSSDGLGVSTATGPHNRSRWVLTGSLTTREEIVLNRFREAAMIYNKSEKSSGDSTPALARDVEAGFPHAEVEAMLRVGRWRRFRHAGAVFCQEGEDLANIAIITRGDFSLRKRAMGEDAINTSVNGSFQDPGRTMLTCGVGDLLGSVEFTNRQSTSAIEYAVPATHTVHSLGEAEVFEWDRDELSSFLYHHPVSQGLFSHLLVTDISHKLSQVEMEKEGDEFYDSVDANRIDIEVPLSASIQQY